MGPRNARHLILGILGATLGAQGSEKGGLKKGTKRDPQQIDFLEPEWLPAGRFGRGRWQRRGARGGKEGTRPSEFGNKSP